MTENHPSEAPVADYLREAFITEDGIEVPPPTREMGPRRLSRYRLDVADFLRALRDGSPLPPEASVEFMSALPQGEPGSGTEEIYQRYQELLAEGVIKNLGEAPTLDLDEAQAEATAPSAPEPEETLGENLEAADQLSREEALLAEITAAEEEEAQAHAEAPEAETSEAQVQDQASEDASAEESPATDGFPAETSIPVEEVEPLQPQDEAEESSADQETTADAQAEEEAPAEADPAQDEDATSPVADQQSTSLEDLLKEPVDSLPLADFTAPLEDEEVEAAPATTVVPTEQEESPEAVATTSASEQAQDLAAEATTQVAEEKTEDEKPRVTPNRFDLIRAKAAKARAMSIDPGTLPSPVNALDSQGLDLKPLDEAEKRVNEQVEQRELSAIERFKLLQQEEAAKTAAEGTTATGLLNRISDNLQKQEAAPTSEPSGLAEAVQAQAEKAEQVSEPTPAETEGAEEKQDYPPIPIRKDAGKFQKAEAAQETAEVSEAETETKATDAEPKHKKSNTSLILGVVSIVVIMVLIFVWLMFFQ